MEETKKEVLEAQEKVDERGDMIKLTKEKMQHYSDKSK
eukprot:CAMPEP_0170472030 /NCGR_PEP_ID=MMETSP0123-20130129/14133_1 /TAXON_ID=182087 /ORGANISM="Favella ehrenbergii, Strain Fehren 1" /LENGTH=37 /DNA_ID= /DNA_START= /DNA_END= /DNA_ORIENTATION=